MKTPLVPQELFLLERYSSLEYFADMRDRWARMLDHVEKCFALFMARLPADYRSRGLPQQPDIVWGERVLPHFRSTMDSLNGALVRLKQGDVQALGVAGNVVSDMRGQTDFWAGWMDEASVASQFGRGSAIYGRLLADANTLAFNIYLTEGAYWNVGALTHRYDSSSRGGHLAPPTKWPTYRLNPSVSVHTDQPVTRTGFYLPIVDDSCAALLIAGNDAPEASIGYEPDLGCRLGIASVKWVSIERVENTFVEDGLADLLSSDLGPSSRRAAGGQACPRAGWWTTPAKVGGRRYFKAGEVMPAIEGSGYGDTFWQWDADQSKPET